MVPEQEKLMLDRVKGRPPRPACLIYLRLGQGSCSFPFNPKPLANLAYRWLGHQKMCFIKTDQLAWVVGSMGKSSYCLGMRI